MDASGQLYWLPAPLVGLSLQPKCGLNWFRKTEHRAAYLERKNLQERVDGTGVPTGIYSFFKPFVQAISTSLRYRFNSAASRY
jgi:hypothetical protein